MLVASQANHPFSRSLEITFTFHCLWITNKADFILVINPFRIFSAWRVWPEVAHYLGNNTVVSSLSVDPSHKSTMHPISHNTPFCNRSVYISVTKWCIVGYGTGALWDLCNRSIVMQLNILKTAWPKLRILTNIAAEDWELWPYGTYHQTSSTCIRAPNPNTLMFLISSYSCLHPIHWIQVLSREWRTTSEWSTILLPTKVRLILDVRQTCFTV